MIEANSDWRDKVRARLAEREQAKKAAENDKTVQKTPDEVKEALKALPLLEIYREWFHPKAEKPSLGDEINVSCFNHLFHQNGDIHPQLGINTRLQIYYCHACQVKGDILDLYAVKTARADTDNRVPDTQVDTVIRELGREKLGAIEWLDSSGNRKFTLTGPANNGFRPIKIGSAAQPQQEETPEAQTPEWTLDTLDWKNILATHSFSRSYMEYCTENSDSPDEYHLYNSFLALGIIPGTLVRLEDRKPVYGNIFLCDVGPTGAGKSGASEIMYEILHEVAPYSNSTGAGIRLSPELASGEAVVDYFAPTFKQPGLAAIGSAPSPPATITHTHIRAVLDYDELSSVMARAARTGSTLDSTLMKLFSVPRAIGIVSRTHGEKIATRPYASLLSGTQPKRLGELISKGLVASGFANRILYVFGHQKIGLAIQKERQPVTLLVNLLKERRRWCEEISRLHNGLITWEPDAVAEFEKFYKKDIVPAKNAGDDNLARVDLMMKKHILWLCIDSMSPTVTLDIVKRAIKFWPYILASYKTVSRNISTPFSREMEREAQRERDNERSIKLVEAFRRAEQKIGKPATKNEVRKNYLGTRSWTIEEINKKVRECVIAGILDEQPPDPASRGQPQPRYSVVID